MNHETFAERFFLKRFRDSSSGYPVATIAYYGPDDQTATKVAVGIVDKTNEVVLLKQWLVRAQDVRIDRSICDEIVSFIKDRHVQRVVVTGTVIGCPHQEGIDYPEGSTCPRCPYWEKIDRWSGRIRTS